MNQTEKYIQKRNIRVLMVAAVLFTVLILMPSFFPGYYPAPEDQAWKIGSEPTRALRYNQCDATDSVLFFSWQSTESRVYAYRHDGTFLFSLEFQDISNGRMHIRCQDGNLYIKLRNNNVFVFQDSQLIAGLTEKQADTQGYTNDWFRSGEGALILRNGTLYYQDDQQSLQAVTTPVQIILPTDVPFWDTETGRVIVFLCAAFFMGSIAYVVFRRGK